MKDNINWEYILGGIGAAIGLFYGTDQAIIRILTALIIFMAFDIVTGIMKSAAQGNITSYKWTTGFMRKIAVLMLISVCYFIDFYKILNMGVSLEAAAGVFFTIGEVISVIENFVDMGVKMPSVVMALLQKGKEAIESGPVMNQSLITGQEGKPGGK
jgi:toxin secretion/phage lysis holin